MNTIARFYNWLMPTVSFDFIKQRSSDECASLLEGTAGMRSRLFGSRLKVEVSPLSERSYSFTMKRNEGFFTVESRGTIATITDTYSRIEGTARTKLTWLSFAISGYILVVFLIVAIGITQSILTQDDVLGSLVAVTAIFVLACGVTALNVLAQKRMLVTYTDMILGVLLRSL